MDDRRTFVKFLFLSPILVYSVEVEAFLPGLIIRFFVKKGLKKFIKGEIRKKEKNLKPNFIKKASPDTHITSKFYDIKPKSNLEKLSDLINRVDNIIDTIDIAKTVWDISQENQGTLVVTHTSDRDFEVPDIDVNISGSNGEITTVNIPSITIKPNEGYAVELGYSGLPLGEKQFAVRQGAASELFDKIIVADTSTQEYKSIPSQSDHESWSYEGGRAGSLCNEVLDKC